MVAQTLFWMTLPAVVYGVLASLLLPPDPPPRWRVRLSRWRTRRQVARAPQPADPFAALSVQIRLGLLATELRALETDPRVWARARRWQAIQAAYDDVLAQACDLAGIDLAGVVDPPGRRPTEPERFHEEMELAARGWSW